MCRECARRTRKVIVSHAHGLTLWKKSLVESPQEVTIFHSFSYHQSTRSPQLISYVDSFDIEEPSTISLTPFTTLVSKHTNGKGEIYQFPLPLGDSDEPKSTPVETFDRAEKAPLEPRGIEIVISGTFRKDNEGLRHDFEEFQDLGCRILSPVSARVTKEVNGFVFMEGESMELPEKIELRHLQAIQEASFVWLHAPEGYVGLSAALEVGFAHAIGIPVYAKRTVSDSVLAKFVSKASSPRDAFTKAIAIGASIPKPAVQAFQKYYKRAALQRGYANESARDTLLLMVEEVGELARSIRKKENLTRHGRAIQENEALELADVFIYVVHLANVLGVSLEDVVRQKELINIKKLLRHQAAL